MSESKIAWITGSGRGIGRATAGALAEKGFKVVLCARTGPEVEDAVREIEANGGQALGLTCDLTDSAQIEALVRTVRGKWGPVEVLVNNAGIGAFKKIVETSEREWDLMMAVNLKAAFLCTRAVLPAMIRARSGHIINIVSVAGRQPYPACGGYCASKYGLLGFTEVLRLETRKYGVHVTAYLPGATDTAIWGEADVDRSRMMKPEKVAQGITALCCGPPAVMVEEVVMRPAGGDL